MAKDKKPKGKKTKAPRKAQPLPRSVQALLKYLGGTDVKLGGARGGQPAQLAPTSINIAVSQQQQQQQQQSQQQQQQFVQQRVAPKGQVISQSPLSAVIPQQQFILGLPQRRSEVEETERKLQAQEKQTEIIQNELTRKFGLLETSQQDFQRVAVDAYQEVKRDIRRRISGDPNIFDARNIAARFSSRPIIEESQFAGVKVGEEEGWTDIEPGAGAAQATQYIENVTNPEMTKIERAKRGPKPLSQEVKAAREQERKAAKELAKATREQEKKAAKESTKAFKTQMKQTEKTKQLLQNIPASSAALLEGTQPTQLSGFSIVTGPAISSKTIVKGGAARQPISAAATSAAPDMATQIALLTGGGAAAPAQSGGASIAQLMGMKTIKKISPGNK